MSDIARALAAHDIAHLCAGNAGPMTLSGTNTYLVGRDPCVVIDPGPAVDEHVEAVAVEAGRRGGAGAIALTHGHHDHTDAVAPLAARLGEPEVVRSGTAGSLHSVPTPGHSADSVTWLLDDAVAFTGDAVLGQGSVFVSGQLGTYLAALRSLRELPLQLLCPGHGPVVTDPAARIDELVAHRLEREERLIGALALGRRTVDELLDEAWSDAPAALRPAAAFSLGAHLEKLDEEGRLPSGVQRPPRLEDAEV